MAVPTAVREWIRRATGSPVASVRRLPGASSAAVHAVHLTDGTPLVLRRYVWEKFRVDEPEAPTREVEARSVAAGLVDWANACIGPAGIDIATCRWNLQEWAGKDAATAFVAAYEALTGRPHHAYWNVAKIVEDDWDLIDDPERVWAAEALLTEALPRLLASDSA